MSREQLRRVGQVATVLAATAILYLTLTPTPPTTSPFPGSVGHFLLFLCLGATSALWYATSELARSSPRRTLIAVLLLLWIFAGATELAQEFILERHMETADWIANTFGAIVGLFAGSFVARLLIEHGR